MAYRDASTEMFVFCLASDVVQFNDCNGLATDLRVRYGLKTPDAIHVATAMDCGADLILTGDHDMARVKEIKVELV